MTDRIQRTKGHPFLLAESAVAEIVMIMAGGGERVGGCQWLLVWHVWMLPAIFAVAGLLLCL
jgi:hypothetical protein